MRVKQMKYKVVAYRSRTLCRVFRCLELYDKPITWGPWKTLKRAKRERAMLNKERCQTIDIDGNVTDHGPTFRKVQIVEIEE